MTVVTRFPPSPTGILHIGNARTAIFNWLFARHHGGRFVLRIEDTDKDRSTPEAIAAIFEGLGWLGLDCDNDPVFQTANAPRHAEIARHLLDTGQAYRCYASPEDLAAMRASQREQGLPIRYDGRWRDRDPADAPAGVAPVVRLRMPQEGATTIADIVQGDVTVENAQLDDMVLLRADGSPTYMLSVVVDDHDMGITHILRGDDHLTNAFRQTRLFRALGWDVPVFGHMPLLHGPDGKKLSKRHGALGVAGYRDLGYLPEAVRNYLTRLGWGHGDDEIFSPEQAIDWFDGTGIVKGPARLDLAKLADLNKHYLRAADDARLVGLITPALATALGRPAAVAQTDAAPTDAARTDTALTDAETDRLLRGMAGLKPRAGTLVELADNALFYLLPRPLRPDAKAAAVLDEAARARLGRLAATLADQADWTEAGLEATVRAAADAEGCKLGQVASPLRAALTGSTVSPGVFDVMAVLGRDEVLGRLHDAAG